MCVSAMQAIPAHPGTAKVRQPDGSYVTLRLLGDEWMRFNTTVDGYSVVKNQRGYYVYAEQKEGRLLPTTRVAHDMVERSAGEQAFLQGVRKYQKPLMADAAAAMYKDRMPIAQIMESLGVKSNRTIYKYLKQKGIKVNRK